MGAGYSRWLDLAVLQLIVGLLYVAVPGCASDGKLTPVAQPATDSILSGEQPAITLPACSCPPVPSTLLSLLPPPRSTSYAEADLVKAGSAFDTLLPYHRVVEASPVVTFNPAWSSPADHYSRLAYCLYSFQLPGYDRNAQVRYTWSTPPTPVGGGYIGLANWDSKAWNWYACTTAGRVNLDSLDPYFAFGGGLLVCVLVTGTDLAVLDEIRIGSQLPVAAYSPSATSGFTPMTVNFTAAASTDPDGSIASYEWDFDGDGVYETDCGQEPAISREYTTTGLYPVGLQITDNDGLTDTVSGAVGVSEPSVHTWGTAASEFPYASAFDSQGNLYIVGITYLVGDESSALIAKFNPAGHLVWSKAFDGPEFEIFQDIQFVDNEIYICGITNSSGAGLYDGLLVRMTPAGGVVWSKTWGGTDNDYFSAMTATGGDLFIVGRSITFSEGSSDALLVKADTSGNIIKARHFGLDYYDEANDVAISRGFDGETRVCITGATEATDMFDTDVLYLTTDTELQYKTRESYGNSLEQRGRAITSSSVLLGGRTIITGFTTAADGTDDLLILNAAKSWAYTWSYGQKACGRDIIRLSSGDFMIAGDVHTPASEALDAVLLTIGSDASVRDVQFRDYGDQDDSAVSLNSFAGGISIVGCAPDNTGAWETEFLIMETPDASWTNISLGLVEIPLQTVDVALNVLEPTGAVFDTGGGASDCLFELRKFE